MTITTRGELELLQRKLERATCPEAVFGPLDRLTEAYRALAKACHPDRVAPEDRPLAESVFKTLGYWRERAGQPGLLAEGLLTTVVQTVFDGRPVVEKRLRNLADTDLLEREYRALLAIRASHADPEVEHGFAAKQRAYLPEPVAFRKSATEVVGVFAVPDGHALTGQALRERYYPQGVPAKHVWWVFRRLLLTLWLAHLRGLAHGAVTPDHLLIYPEAHGLVLLDWTCASRIDKEHIPLYDPAWEALCPPELFAKAPATIASDLYQAAQTALYLLGDQPIDAPIQAFFTQCCDPDPTRRFHDAERAHERFGTLLGPRTFAEWRLPWDQDISIP